MKTLVIAEKPDMGRNIAAVIEPKAVNKRTHLEGERYVITWAIGHLIGLAEPDHYDEKYKKWRLQDLPIIPEDFRLLPNPRTKDQLGVIKELAARCGELVNACDAGREGQHIFSLIKRYLRLNHPVKRLWISDLTPETIRKGFEQLKDDAEYLNLTVAARSRSEADWLIGMNGSRAFTTKHGELLSVGRVQTPVLALIYDRQLQIESFDSQKYYEVYGFFGQESTSYRGMWQGERITDPERAERLAAKVKGVSAKVESYEIKDTKEYPWKLYDLTLLQRDANGKFGFSAKKTLDIAQSLYEKHKVISYPRTNSNYVTEQNIPEMHRVLGSLRGSEYDALVQGANRNLVHTGNRNVCNPSKVEDHHAIMPTFKKPGALSPEERKLYDLIVRRFLSHYYPAAEYKVHTVMTVAAEERFKTTIKEKLSDGWKVVYAGQAADGDGGNAKGKGRGKKGDKDDGGSGPEREDETEEIETPFVLNPDLPVACADAEVKAKETQPPKHYTEGTLLKAMESAGKQIEDEELRDAMKDSGLGTPATRAATIERLKQVGYIDMQGKKLTITRKGRTAIELIRGAGVELLASPEMTGHWERRLTEISRGQASAEKFMENVKKFAVQIVERVRGQQQAAKTAFAADEKPVGARGRGKAATATRAKRTTAPAEKKQLPAQASSSPDAPAGTVARCPRPGCGGHIFMGRKGYGCSEYKTGCKFVIWKDSFGRTLTDAMVRSLVEKGKTSKLKLKDEGGEFEARLVLADPGTGELRLDRA
ncbi:DNA topoisomerase 3 [Cohnella sp. CFH 77786]|uniref:type IA DNA topoisomerase n=1 Tax=Cohnella sp. CFH 77786 TaxID=2662265 RepID=UPI001C60FAC9|nr:type IA DNA topoisomerase [Cohnella sp. CFH 77786]MBW5447496.1 DNA topoisomerase 3 [Cohnella sp. CFH 77786]